MQVAGLAVISSLKCAELGDVSRFAALEMNGHTLGWVGLQDEPQAAGFIEIVVADLVFRVKCDELWGAAAFSPAAGEDGLSSNEKWFIQSFGRAVVLHLPVGSVDLLESSFTEGLILTERSIVTVKTALANFLVSFYGHVQRQINAVTVSEAVTQILTDLEGYNYPRVDEFAWHGKPVGGPMFSLSDAQIIDFHNYGSPPFHKAKFSSISSMDEFMEYISEDLWKFRTIVVPIEEDDDFDDVAETLANEDDRHELLSTLKGDAPALPLFILVRETDFLINVFEGTRRIVMGTIRDVVAKRQETERQKALEEQRILEEEAKKLTSFVPITGKSPTSNEQFIHRKPVVDIFANTAEKKYYWSFEEVAGLGFTGESLVSLFPYATPEGEPVNFLKVVTHEYHWDFQRFLSFIFPEGDNRFILLGEGSNVEEFRASFPDVESGVFVAKNLIESKLNSQVSELTILWKSLSQNVSLNYDAPSRLIELHTCLEHWEKGEEVLASLPEPLFVRMETVRIMKQVRDKPHPNVEFLRTVLPGFGFPASSNFSSNINDYYELESKYPLLFNLKYVARDSLEDLISYIQMKG